MPIKKNCQLIVACFLYFLASYAHSVEPCLYPETREFRHTNRAYAVQDQNVADISLVPKKHQKGSSSQADQLSFTLILYAAQPSSAGVVTIQNNSPSVTALHISVVDLPPGLTQDSSNCSIVNPGATCTLLIYPGTSAVSSAITIQGVNTSAFVINVQVIMPPLNRVAVGLGVDALSGVQVPLAYLSGDGGTTWSTPNTAPNMPVSSSLNVLKSVSCSTTGICVAVGSTTIGGVMLPLIYHSMDTGLNWSAPYLPTPPGLNTLNVLNAVSCSASGTLCTAVGRTKNSVTTRNNPLSYYSVDGGVTWIASSTTPLIGNNTVFIGVTCGSSGLHCVAVGRSLTLSTIIPVAYISNDGGQSWVPASQLPAPPTQFVTFDSELNGVSCSSDGAICSAVGYSIDANTALASALSYTSTDGGVTWGAPVLLPANSTTDNALYGVNCSSSGLICTAVGTTNLTSSGGNLSYTTTDGGTIWSNPVLPQGSGGIGDSINGVFCDNSGLFCSAVGSNTNSIYSFFSSNSGVNWSSLVLIATPGFTSSNLGGVSGSR